MAYVDVVAVKKAVKDGALVVKVIDGNILLADVKFDEAAKIGELPVGRWHLNEDGKWACPCCDGLAVEDPYEPDKWQALTRCCPNCGARMKGETK